MGTLDMPLSPWRRRTAVVLAGVLVLTACSGRNATKDAKPTAMDMRSKSVV